MNLDAAKKKESLLPEAVDVADIIHWWPDRSSSTGGPPIPKFIHIAALHSELIAVSNQGQLYQWRWADREPYVQAEVWPESFKCLEISGVRREICLEFQIGWFIGDLGLANWLFNS